MGVYLSLWVEAELEGKKLLAGWYHGEYCCLERIFVSCLLRVVPFLFFVGISLCPVHLPSAVLVCVA